MKKTLMLAALGLLLTTQAYAEDAAFAEGKALFKQNCLKCHNAELRPHKAPPMFMVQRHYKMATQDRQAFIDKLTAFATHPTDDKAIIRMAVKKLGVMPDQGFAGRDVRLIAGYIHDERFSMPRGHMKGCPGNKSGGAEPGACMQGKSGGMCKQQKGAALSPASPQAAEDGSLKAVMQQLGRSYAELDHAILMQDFDAAAEAAHHIAHHDKPALAQRMKLMAALRSEMSGFKQADGKVHALAVDIEKAAKARDLPLLIKHQSGMLSACMACHSAYRSKVMTLLK